MGNASSQVTYNQASLGFADIEEVQVSEAIAQKKIAVIMAHPDDAEFMCAGSVAKWVREGHEVVYVLMTSGDKGSDDPSMTGEMLMAMREAEQREACRILGVSDVVFMRYPDAMIVADLDTRRDMVRVLRRLKPDRVVCQDPTVRYFGEGYINHPDHRATADAVLDAVYPAARDRMTFPELLGEGLEPHKVREVYLMAAGEPNLYIDITDTIDIKLDALRAHASQMNGWDPEEEVTKWSAEDGQKANPPVAHAEDFRRFVLD